MTRMLVVTLDGEQQHRKKIKPIFSKKKKKKSHKPEPKETGANAKIGGGKRDWRERQRTTWGRGREYIRKRRVVARKKGVEKAIALVIESGQVNGDEMDKLVGLAGEAVDDGWQ